MDNLDILHELSNMDLLTSLHEDEHGKDFIQNRTYYLCISLFINCVLPTLTYFREYTCAYVSLGIF